MKKLSSEASDRGIFTLLSVSSNSEDHRLWREMVPHDHFRVTSTSSYKDAARITLERPPAVIVCDRRLTDGSWRDLLVSIAKLHDPPPLIVTARHADERLWAEVLNLGGYDVLAKPLDALEVDRVLKAACGFGRVAIPEKGGRRWMPMHTDFGFVGRG